MLVLHKNLMLPPCFLYVQFFIFLTGAQPSWTPPPPIMLSQCAVLLFSLCYLKKRLALYISLQSVFSANMMFKKLWQYFIYSFEIQTPFSPLKSPRAQGKGLAHILSQKENEYSCLTFNSHYIRIIFGGINNLRTVLSSFNYAHTASQFHIYLSEGRS